VYGHLVVKILQKNLPIRTCKLDKIEKFYIPTYGFQSITYNLYFLKSLSGVPHRNIKFRIFSVSNLRNFKLTPKTSILVHSYKFSAFSHYELPYSHPSRKFANICIQPNTLIHVHIYKILLTFLL
jgi:hypothetical protein